MSFIVIAGPITRLSYEEQGTSRGWEGSNGSEHVLTPGVQLEMEAVGVSAKGETMFQERKVLTEQKPYTMSGLARALGLSRQALLEYSARDEFGDSMRAAKDRCQEYAESQLFGRYANGAKFNLITTIKASTSPGRTNRWWLEIQKLRSPIRQPA